VKKSELVFPILHDNGSGYVNLNHGYMKTLYLINELMETMCNAIPNARDYYVTCNPNTYINAHKQYSDQIRKLSEIKEYIIESIADLDKQNNQLKLGQCRSGME
jgi:hypothetical protein